MPQKKGGWDMKIIVWRSPKFLRGLLRAIFRVKDEK